MIGWLLRRLMVDREPSGPEALFTEPTPEEVLGRRRELARAYWWLRESLPELWYSAPHLDVIDMAEALVTLKRGVEAGRWEVEAVRS